MVSSEMLVALLGSAVAASLITSLFAKSKSDKDVIIENIIAERKAWRDKLRDLVSDIERCVKEKDHNGVTSAEAKLVVLLNPYDKEDLKIIQALNRIPESWEKAYVQEFMDRVAYLLKHDWERVKQESTTRVSPQTLALACFFVGLVTIVTGWVLSWQSGLQTIKFMAFWLAAVFFIVALIANGPKSPYSCKKFVFWITNKPFREPYHERNDR